MYAKKVATFVIFFVVYLLKWSGSYLIPEAWMRTIWGLFCYFVLATCFHASVVKKITMACFLCLISALPEYIVHGLLMLFAGNVYAIGSHNLQDYALGLLISKFILVFLCSFLYYWQCCKRENMFREMKSRWYYCFLIYPAITLIVLIQNYYLILNDEQFIHVKGFVLSGVLLVLSNAVIFQILAEMQRLQVAKLKVEIAEKQLLVQEKHYAELTEKNSAIKKHIHDTKNFLLVIQSYISHGKLYEAEEHLKEFLDTLVNKTVDYTGNIVIDTVLATKIKEAEKNAITIVPAIALYGEIYIKVIDLALLLGNALDNAIEATAKNNSEIEKNIYVTVKLYQDILHIVVRNPVDYPVHIENNSITTSKDDKEMHGFGISNMKMLARKYNGTIDMRCINGSFVLNIILENGEDDVDSEMDR